MERRQFPDLLELITGKFLRHTPEFYYWRVQDRLAKLKKAPSNEKLYDDLAVAYSKLGQNQKAIDLMMEKEMVIVEESLLSVFSVDSKGYWNHYLLHYFLFV